MTDATWVVQVSPRIGNTLVNLRAETPDQMENLLTWVANNATNIANVEELLGAQATIAQVMPGSQNVQPSSQPSWGGQGSGAATPPPAQQQTQGPGPVCAHGPMEWKTGTSAKGPWKAWMCPAGKNDPYKCDPQWVR